MGKFNWEDFKLVKIAVHCKTEHESSCFLELANKHFPYFGNVYDNKDGGYYACFDSRMYFNTKQTWKYNNYTILEWSDYMFTNEDLKVGMLVETSIGGGIVMPSSSELVVIYEDGNWSLINFSDVNKVYGYSNDPCFAMSYSSFHRDLLYERPTAKEMTVEEVSKALGYDVKIVKG